MPAHLRQQVERLEAEARHIAAGESPGEPVATVDAEAARDEDEQHEGNGAPDQGMAPEHSPQPSEDSAATESQARDEQRSGQHGREHQ